MRRKGIVIMLLLAILLPIICVAPQVQATEVQAAQTDLHGTIEQQIRAYADSIDQKDADGSAARILAMHGMMMGGKTLNADENHALTATLMNSAMAQKVLIDSCEAAIRSMQQLDLDRLEYVRGHIHWGGIEDRFYFMRVYSSADQPRDKCDWSLTTTSPMGSAVNWNEYDESLTWMGGGIQPFMSFKLTRVTADSVTYQVNLEFKDRFDFATSGSDFFKDLISGIGSLLFREFDWSAKVTFDLTVPYTCCHESQNYRFTYDAESKTITSDSASGWNANNATRHSYSSNDGTVSYYYELAETVRLRHDAPWVMEFDSRSPNSFGLSPLSVINYSYPVLHKNARSFLYLCDNDWTRVSQDIMDEFDLTDEIQSIRHYYGTSLNDRFDYSWGKTYTFHLENELRADGSNMIYLTVRETDTGTIVLDRTPMDDYYYYESWTQQRRLKDESNAWVSGQDLLINYIGFRGYPFTASHFELRVWENGIDGGNRDYFVDEKVKATCSTPGGVRHTCQACGYTYYSDETPALGHDWGSYKSNNDATCQKDGTKTAVCKTCGEEKTVVDEGSQANHDWTPATCLYLQTCLTCGETQGELGDHDFAEATCTKPRTCKVCGETEGDCLPHTWQEPNCTDPKKCAGCGLTEGSALGHEWTGVTCQHANTCTVCGFVKGEPKEHTWVEATCTEAKHCAFCGTIEGEPLGHDFIGGGCTERPQCSRCGERGEPFGHQWTAADCYSARSCSVCGFADGVALGHSWIGPTCTEAKYCGVCGIVEGEPLGHIFADATCDTPRTCTGCELTEGEPLGHDWIDADCENPRHCTRCAATEGEPQGHSWVDASCAAPKTCGVCGKTEGIVTDHSDSDGDLACDHCGQDLRVPAEPTEPPATTAPTQTPTTEPPATEPDEGEEESGNGLIWIIGGIALAAIGAVSAGLILRKKKN